MESTNSCEAAFVVRDSKRGEGMAKALMAEMIDIARERKLSKMIASVRRDNKLMLTVFERAGFVKVLPEEFGEINLELSLEK
ncbi:MAG: GNAT family N-acetyltransferase [Gammaproteobacteria bacterium]|nr:GNAT family N-acetyltransferase [Gammaproteobacteria bacterium]